MLRTRFRPLLALLAVAGTLAFMVVESDARPRGSMGSRGSKTYDAAPPTATTPNAAPINRSMTQPGTPGTATTTAARPNAAAPAAGGGMFGGARGLLGGLAAGFLGAGLIGMLMGGGFMSGIAGFASILGLILQVGIIVLLGMLAWRWWQRRSQPATASGPDLRESATDARKDFALRGAGFGGGSFGGHGAAAAEQPVYTTPLELTAEDFDAFERLLGEVQTAYGREDMAALRSRLTPEMLSYYAEEMAENQSRGVINEIKDVKLLQGDLAEAWREGDAEYATVAMRYSLVDRFIDRNTGKAAEGNDAPQEATEVWTFRRSQGGTWVLSAIQQA
jgi:predicted lipid-binding transport protein (Tim44 family)